ncbi:hypothetical protein ETSB_0654 [cyanobacterium endosymbiont of Epithemia turgida isolate EtSB Lake Yunoko]|nr:hypothetical protein ETSB_0654 [cyanobacterium endosymbiont of Epithemia turgida isolate EtSB Lake Yunoko]
MPKQSFLYQQVDWGEGKNFFRTSGDEIMHNQSTTALDNVDDDMKQL